MKVFNNLIHKEFKEMFWQAREWLIINFGKEIEYSLHIACFVRVMRGSQLLLTSSDEYFNTDRTQKCDEDKPGNLLEKNLKIVNEIMRGAIVVDVKRSDVGDIMLTFNNKCTIEISVDCIFEGYEYYRIIEYIPYYKDDAKHNSHHYALIYRNGKQVFEEQ